MKVTVEVSDEEMALVTELTGERKNGPAIRRLMSDALQLKKRERIAQHFLSGDWGVELEGHESARQRDRERAAAHQASLAA